MAGEASDVRTWLFRRDIGDGMHARGTLRQHGKPDRVIEHGTNRQPARVRPGAMGDGEAGSTVEAG